MINSPAARFAYVLLRLVSGLIIFQAGCLKLFGWFGGIDGHGAAASIRTQMGIGGSLEIVGGLAVMLGLFTRPVAFLLSGEMAVAYWQFHAPNGAWPIINHGEQAVLFCFIFLFIVTQGGGPFSIDALLRRRRVAAADAAPME